jgi:hypothetical protein
VTVCPRKNKSPSDLRFRRPEGFPECPRQDSNLRTRLRSKRAKGRRLVGLFAGMYYAGLRPEEAVAVTLPDSALPETGWGRLVLHRTRPQAGKKWTDSGQFHDERGLKNRRPAKSASCPSHHPWSLSGATASRPSAPHRTDGCSSPNAAPSSADTGVNGTAARLRNCQSYAEDQHWTHNANGSLSTIGRCLDSPSGATSNGTRLQIYDRNSSAAQKFALT